MRKRSVFFNLFIIIAIVFLVILIAQFSSQEIQNRVTIFSAVFGFLAILYQLRSDHKIKRAEFIYSLNDSFHKDNEIKKSYKLLKEARDTNMEKRISETDCLDMGNYLMFFMILNYLVDKKLVSMTLIDKIFANKFFMFVNHPDVQTHQISATSINYPILELFEKWYNYRLVHKSSLLYERYCLSHNKSLFERKKNGMIRYKDKRSFSLKTSVNILFNRPNITPASFKDHD